jgi:hypothetical protein
MFHSISFEIGERKLFKMRKKRKSDRLAIPTIKKKLIMVFLGFLNEKNVIIDMFLNFHLFNKINWSSRIFFPSNKVRKSIEPTCI